MKLIINGKEAKIPSGGSSSSVTMDQVNSAIDTKLDAYEPQEVYSTEETRIGTWVDGKPLYRKVFTFSYTASASAKTLTSAINGIMVVMINAWLRYTGSNTIEQMAVIDSKSVAHRIYYNPSAGIQILSNQPDWNGSEITVILEYTKTTDTATVKLEASERAVYAAAKAKQYATPSAAVTASGAAEIENIQT